MRQRRPARQRCGHGVPQIHTWRGAERAAGWTAERPVRFNPGMGTRHLPSRAARAPAPLTRAGPLPQRTAPLAPSSLTAEHPSPHAGFSRRRSPAAPHGQAPQPRQHRPRPSSGLTHTRLTPAPTAPQPRSASHTSHGHGADTRISHRHHTHTRIFHTHHMYTDLTYTDLPHTDPMDTRISLIHMDLTGTRSLIYTRILHTQIPHTHGSHT